MISDISKISGQLCAKYVKYYLQFKNKNIFNPVSVNQVGYKNLYNKYKKIFDELALVFNKHNLEISLYIKYFIIDLNNTEYSIVKLIDKQTFEQYKDFLQKNRKMKKIYNWFIKSSKNIAIECVKNNYFTTKDFLKAIIDQKKLGNYYITGKISRYYLAAIPKFDKIVPHLDYFTRCELKDFVTYYQIYNTDVNQSFMYFKNRLINPIDFTDKIILKIKEKINSK